MDATPYRGSFCFIYADSGPVSGPATADVTVWTAQTQPAPAAPPEWPVRRTETPV